MKPFYRFSIRTVDNKYYNLGAVTSQVPYYLPHAPQEWGEMERKLERSLRHSGLFAEYSPDAYTFVLEGAQILRNIFNQGGANAVAYFHAEELVSTTQDYIPYTAGKIDFNTYSDEKLFVEVAIIEGGVTQMLALNEDTEVAIPVTGNEVYTVRIPSLPLQGSARWSTVWPNDADPVTQALDTICMVNVSSEGLQDPITAAPANYTNGKILFKINRDIKNIKFKGHLNYYLDNNTGSAKAYTLFFTNLGGTGFVGTFKTLASGSIAAGTDQNLTTNIDFTHSGTLLAGTHVILWLDYDNAGTTDYNVVWENNNPLEISFEYQTDSFNVAGYSLNTLGDKLIRAITNNTGKLKSDYLNGMGVTYANNYDNRPPYTIAIPGDSIRGLNTSPFNTPAIKTTWSDYFKALLCLYDVGCNVDGTDVYIKRKGEYFNPNKMILDLGKVDNVRIYNARDHQFNKMSIGYKDQEYDELNGRDEYNTTHVYELPNENKAELELVNPYRADIWGIYKAWANTNASNTKDTTSDNSVFLVEVYPTPTAGVYDVLRLPGSTTGVETLNGLGYNFGLTPKRCFLRKKKSIYSGLFKREGQSIKFKITDKNAKLSSSFSAGPVDEDADVPVASLGVNTNDRYYVPIMCEVPVGVPKDFIKTVKANSDGYIKFTWRGKVYKMYPWDIGEVPSVPKLQTLIGISLPDNTFEGQ